MEGTPTACSAALLLLSFTPSTCGTGELVGVNSLVRLRDPRLDPSPRLIRDTVGHAAVPSTTHAVRAEEESEEQQQRIARQKTTKDRGEGEPM